MTSYNAVSRISLAAFGGILAAAGLTLVGAAAGAASVLVGGTWWAFNGRHSQTLHIGTCPPLGD